MSQPKTIAIFVPNWLGDLVMATPTLRALRHHFPKPCRLIGIMRPNLAEVLAGTEWLDTQWYFNPRSKNPDERRWALVRRMRRESLDMAILMTNSLHTAALAWAGGARQRIGYVGYVRCGRGPLLTTKLVPQIQSGRIVAAPVVDTYLALAEAAGCEAISRELSLAVSPSEQSLAADAWEKLGLRTDGRVVGLNCSGAYGAAKLWPWEHFGDLARRVAEQLDHDVLVICGPAEQETARNIVKKAAHGRVFSLAEQPPSIGLSKACLARTQLVVSTDSGPRHVAAALGKPVITLLGPTAQVWIDNPTVHGSFVSAEVDCLACAKRVCPRGHHRCMRELSPKRVFEEVAHLLEEQKTARAA